MTVERRRESQHLSPLEVYKPEPVRTHRLKMNLVTSEDGFKFGLLGLFNTARDNSVYKATAHYGRKFKVDLQQPDWDSCTQSQFILASPKTPDTFVEGHSLNQFSCIVYQLQRYCLDTRTFEPEYGFAVQPLTYRDSRQLWIVGGQFQLPVFKGPVPEKLLEQRQNYMTVLSDLSKRGKISLMEGFTQVISRVCPAKADNDKSYTS